MPSRLARVWREAVQKGMLICKMGIEEVGRNAGKASGVAAKILSDGCDIYVSFRSIAVFLLIRCTRLHPVKSLLLASRDATHHTCRHHGPPILLQNPVRHKCLTKCVALRPRIHGKGHRCRLLIATHDNPPARSLNAINIYVMSRLRHFTIDLQPSVYKVFSHGSGSPLSMY